MNNQEMNKYILHYIENDRTHSAIMLSGDWGTGKSYYIQNDLIPFLECDEEYYQKNGIEFSKRKTEYNCVVISLYGLTKIEDISKSIYFEIKTGGIKKRITESSFIEKHPKILEATIIGKGIGKTIIKGIAAINGIDIGMSEEDLQKLYESVDLTGKLLILEDIERTQIDKYELLGFVNSLVEQDDIKVLLVANEKEIVKQVINDSKKLVYTEDTLKYLSIKEKTISDTLDYKADLNMAVKNIIMSFSNTILSEFATDYYVNSIIKIMGLMRCYNLRSFIFACQKTSDIFEVLKTNEEKGYLECLLYSIVAFSFRLKKSGNDLSWPYREECSFDLGLPTAYMDFPKCPLFRFCYDYIMFHKLDLEKAQKSKQLLHELRLYDLDKSKADPDLRIIYDYYKQKESDVRLAVRSIQHRIKSESDIAFSEYGRLGMILIRISHVLNINVSEIKEQMIKNLQGKGDKLRPEALSDIIEDDKDEKILEEFKIFKQQMQAALKCDEFNLFTFPYTKKTINQFIEYVHENRSEIKYNSGLLNKLNIDRLVELLKKCTADEIHELRGAFWDVYRDDTPFSDNEALSKLRNELQALLAYDKYDLIQKYQIELFINNVETWLQNTSTD